MTAPVLSVTVPWIPPLLAWPSNGRPPRRAVAQSAIRQTQEAKENFPRRRRESPSGKDPTVVLRYIVLLHLILRWKALGWDADYFRFEQPEKPCAGDLKPKIHMSRNAKKVFVCRRDCQ